MSSLSFDKQGKPFAFQRRTKKLLVRLFRNPSARGTCCQVLDGEGQPLYIDPETDYAEFRKAIGHVPGLYRLDQCDDDGNELGDAQPAYVSIDVARNAQSMDGVTGELSPLVIIQQMAAQQADVMRTMAQEQAKLMAASAEILRAPYRPVPVAMALPAGDLRNAEAGGARSDADEEGDDELDEPAPEHPMTAALRMLEPYLPQLGAMAYQKTMEFFREMNGRKPAPPAATAASPTTPSAAPPVPGEFPAVSVDASHVHGPQVMATSVATDTSTRTSVDALEAEVVAPSTEAAQTNPGATSTAPVVGRPSLISPVASAVAMPTPAQLMHLHAIRADLSDRERAIAERVITRMDSALRAQYLAELSALTVERATEVIRTLITKATA